MILLDTTACIDYLRGLKPIKKIIQDTDEIFAITSVSIYEVSIGLERTKRLRSEEIYQTQVISWKKFLSLMKILDLNPDSAAKAAKIYDHLSQIGKIIEDDDILIAGIMKSHNIKRIVTRNQKHFDHISDIIVVNYSEKL